MPLCAVLTLSTLCVGQDQLPVSTLSTRVLVEANAGSVRMTSLADGKRTVNWAGRGVGTPLIGFAVVDGERRDLKWELKSVKGDGSSAEVTYGCDSPKLVWKSTFKGGRYAGPVETWISIENRSGKALELPLQKTLCWAFKPVAGHAVKSLWVEKEAATPSVHGGVHIDPLEQGVAKVLRSDPYARDTWSDTGDFNNRDAVPMASMRDEQANVGCYCGIEFSGRVSLKIAYGDTGVATQTGIADEPEGSPEFRTRLAPGETYVLPTVFVGCYEGSFDDGANDLSRWVREKLLHPAPDAQYPTLTLNSWGSGMAVDSGLAMSMIRDAAALGVEMYHIDAGWFRGTGDWLPDQAKFPNGLAPVADAAHSLGMKFGLWVGWTQGGTMPDDKDRWAVLNVHAPDRLDWFAQDHGAAWQPQAFSGADLCLSNPHACGWCLDLLRNIVSKYKLDMLEHDQRMIVDQCDKTDHPHTSSRGDIAYRATLGYYGVYDALRSENPKLLFEDCVNGGRMVDYGVIKRVNYISIVDTYSPLDNRRAFYDASYALPASVCECYMSAQNNANLGEFVSMLRSAMMGWCTVMQDTNRWSPDEKAAAKREFELYKTKLRPFIRSGNLYHASARPDGIRWDGMQYAAVNRASGVLFAFRGANGEPIHTFAWHGLDPSAEYKIHFEDGGQNDYQAKGLELMKNGVVVRLPLPTSSQLVFVTKG